MRRGRARQIDRFSLVAGVVLLVFGVVLLLDRSGTLRLTFATMAPMAFAVVGVILLASGLSRRE
ncbi:MAG TPA: DUF5668 domain-containing protein [Solirubrobacteraceae bacterium]|nr:DUF5668 domain-containing protein [Solirubrobacteraceae bacterium]